MYTALQSCRLGGEPADAELAAIESVLACILVRGTVALAPDEPDLTAAVTRLHPVQEEPLWNPRGLPLVVELSAANQAVFDVLVYAFADLRRLTALGERLAVRNLGYGLHNLPRHLVIPHDFDRNAFAFSLRFIAYRWALLSVELRTALAALVERTPERLEKVVTAEGFAKSMFRERTDP